MVCNVIVVGSAHPSVKGHVQDQGEQTTSHDGALPQQVIADEVNAGKPLLPCGEDEEHDEAEDNHGDEGS